MQVAAWMVRHVHTCRPEDSLADAARILREMDCGCLPIVDRLDTVIGILTDRDICMVAGDADEGLDRIRVSSLKRRPVITCSPDDDEIRVLELMDSNRVRRLPVVNSGGGLLGIVSLGNLAGLVTDGHPPGEIGISAEQVVQVFARFSRSKYRTRYTDAHGEEGGDGMRLQGHDRPPV